MYLYDKPRTEAQLLSLSIISDDAFMCANVTRWNKRSCLTKSQMKTRNKPRDKPKNSTHRESRLFSIFHIDFRNARQISVGPGRLSMIIRKNRFHDEEHANLLNSMWYVIAMAWAIAFNLLEQNQKPNKIPIFFFTHNLQNQFQINWLPNFPPVRFHFVFGHIKADCYYIFERWLRRHRTEHILRPRNRCQYRNYGKFKTTNKKNHMAKIRTESGRRAKETSKRTTTATTKIVWRKWWCHK